MSMLHKLSFTLFLLLSLLAINLDSVCAQEKLPSKKQSRPASFENPYLIEFKGEINTKLYRYFLNRFKKAKKKKADLLIIEISSPGGYLLESVEIAEMLKDCDWAYTVAFIPENAYSGAALIGYGCDEAVIAKDGRIGDIGVVALDPTLMAFRYADAKARSAFVRQARDIAEAKRRSPDLIEAMIDKNIAIYSRKNAKGDWEFKKKNIIDGKPLPPVDGKWKLIDESGINRFLLVNGLRAKELGIAEENASEREEVFESFNVADRVKVESYKTADSIAYWLSNPIITGLLVIVGLIALYVELSAPGIGAGGLIAGLCAILFFWSRFMGGTSGWLEVILFGAGLTFLLMEIFVIPGWGISGFTGIILLGASALLASQGFVLPESTQQWNQTLTTVLVLGCSCLIVIIAAGIIAKKMGSIPGLNRMVLGPVDDDDSDDATGEIAKPGPASHPPVSVGDWGQAESVLRPSGRARFGRHSVDVVSDGTFIEPGDQVRVLEIEGNRIVVELVDPAESPDETVYKDA